MHNVTSDTANANTRRQQDKPHDAVPRIYAACLAAYNNGYLHGCWIEAAQDSEEIDAEISEMLKASPIPQAEEWAIHDFEGFEGARLEEYSGIDRAHAFAVFIVEHGRLGGELLNHFCGDLEEAELALENYAGEYKCLADFAQELTEETMQIPEALAYYIDYAAMARDMELNGDVFTLELGHEEVHVFWSR